MNLQFYKEKLLTSENFKKFKKQNPDSYPCSCFISLDLENPKNPNNQFHFDFYCPKNKKMFSFQSENNMKKIPIETFKKTPTKISLNHDFEFNNVEKLITTEMQKQNIKNKIQKILLSLQNIDNKDILVGTIFISSLGMLKVNIDITSKKIIHFEKKSLLDMINVFKKK